MSITLQKIVYQNLLQIWTSIVFFINYTYKVSFNSVQQLLRWQYISVDVQYLPKFEYSKKILETEFPLNAHLHIISLSTTMFHKTIQCFKTSCADSLWRNHNLKVKIPKMVHNAHLHNMSLLIPKLLLIRLRRVVMTLFHTFSFPYWSKFQSQKGKSRQK